MAERRYPHPMPREGITGTVTELVDDVQRLVQLEIELLQLELKELAIRNAIAIGLIATAAMGVLFAVIFLQVTLVEAVPLPTWLNALLLAAFWVIVAVTLFLVGRARIKIEPPEKTIQSIKEDLEWVKAQIRLITK
ncbi:MAG: phage holin family protein [Candidatus Dormiibacterota bacterium]